MGAAFEKEEQQPEPSAPAAMPGAKWIPAWARVGDWWEYKLVPALLSLYFTALFLGATAWDAIEGIGWLFLALLPGAIFVSVLNDLTDRDDDREAGKPNRLAGLPLVVPMAILTACIAIGIAISWHWRDEPMLLGVYATGWIAYTLYSTPPVRLKKRGFAGLLSDAIGANMVPAAMGALVCAWSLGVPLAPEWLALLAVWSLGFGLRGILWHQIVDLENDQRSRVHTWVARVGEDAAARFARLLVAPLEVLALVGLIALAGSPGNIAALVALTIYGFFLGERIDRFRMRVTLVRNKPRSSLLLHEYYDVMLPLALLVACTVLNTWNLVLLALHMAVFPARWRQVFREIIMLRDPRFESRLRDES